MTYNVLTRIDRELLKLDPEFAPPQKLKDLVWARSSIQSVKEPLDRQAKSALSSLLSAFKDFFRAFLAASEKAPPALPRPKLAPPARPPREGSFRPPRYFSKGTLQRQQATPIPQLLVETNEISKARPVPGNSLFLRSLAKGKGVLKKNDQGLYYLDIDNRFILSLIPYLKAFGLVRAPYFNLFQAPEGAHIPVIPPREAAFHFLDRIEGTEQEFSFEIEGLYSIEPTLWPEVEQVWFFKVRSPELEALRQKNLLLPRPGGHSFHIAVAVKPRQTKIRQPLPMPIMRINPAFLAA